MKLRKDQNSHAEREKAIRGMRPKEAIAEGADGLMNEWVGQRGSLLMEGTECV
jgi:hypothetical protein